MIQLTPEQLAACREAYCKEYGYDPEWDVVIDEGFQKAFAAGLSHARAESAKELASLTLKLECAHRAQRDAENELSRQMARAAMENGELKAQVEALYSAALWGISHVGTANYQHRQTEAIRRVQEIRYPAIAQEKPNDR